MIKIRVTAPFRYQFVNAATKKDIFLGAGDYYHLDQVKDKAEIKHVLSPTFPFRNYIHVELETVPQALKEEIGIEAGSYEEYTLPETEEFFVYTQTDKQGQLIEEDSFRDEAPAQEPEANKFDLTTDPKKVAAEEKALAEPVTEENLGIEEAPSALPVEEPTDEVEDVVAGGELERDARKEELEDLHYSKIKEIAEVYNIDYSTKKETIEVILNLEYGDNDAESPDIPV